MTNQISVNETINQVVIDESNSSVVKLIAAGPQGIQGAASTVAGPSGTLVRSGSDAPANTLGNNGDWFIETTNNRLYGPKADNEWPGEFVSLVGPSGTLVRSGSDEPADSLGNNGDWYIDSTSHVLYGPKASNTWPTPGTNLVGPQGQQGIQGEGSATVTIGTTSLGSTSTDVSVTNSGSSTEAVLNFTIPRGETGTDGTDGKTILNGSGTPSGGNNGDFWIDTNTNKLYGPKANDTWDTSSFVSLVGADGTDGKSVLNGSGVPQSTDGVDGDFWLETTNTRLYGPKSNGAWSSYVSLIGSGGGGGGISNVVEDTSPQLGGALDVQAQEINTSTTNGNIKLAPNGTGLLEVKGNTNSGTIQLNCEDNSHGVKIKGPPHSASASYTFTLPNDIQENKYLKTDSSGNTSWDTPPDTNTTYSVGDGGLTQNNFTDTLKTKLDGIADNATANAGTITSVTGTSPIASTGGATPAISISEATTSAAGSMSSADKTKLDAIEESADVTDTTNVDSAGAVMNSDLDGKGEILVGDGDGDPTALAVGGTNGHVLMVDSSESTGVKWASHKGIFTSYAQLVDQKASNVHGGAVGSSTGWEFRDLNTEKFDPDGIVLGFNGVSTGTTKSNGSNTYTVATNTTEFALGAGTYFIRARAPAIECSRSMFYLRIYNNFDAARSSYYSGGSSSTTWTNTATAGGDPLGSVTPELSTRFTLTETKLMVVRQYFQGGVNTDSYAQGISALGSYNSTIHSIYTVVDIYKE